MLKLLRPSDSGDIYDIATTEFLKYYNLITGKTLEVITEDDGESELVVLGSDADNEYTASLYVSGKFKGFDFKYGSDGFCVRSHVIDGRNHLFIGGGRDRALLYAIYTYFERVCGCRWFWDGDRVPKDNGIRITDVEICESPRFEYRGLRYFAHRGLHRFQAEHWGYDDWKREIDWILKKRLNLFMLRIGNDDIFQKAFPESVSYPAPDYKEDKRGYNDRTSAWPLEYRGRLRKKILDYAFARDLSHPEDCGTITHWYSPTPADFLENEKPDLFEQSTATYNFKDALVWDIRKSRNMENYIKLTETHIREYGREGLFHTIGFAERMFSDDRAENQRMKLYVYHKIISYLRRRHPYSKLMIASWDLWYKYTAAEIKELLKQLDPEHSIILDYTSDSPESHNFTSWDLVGKFPYVFGIFQAYCNNSGPLGRYDVIEERLEIARKDSMCKGMVFWPELSHGDNFMLEYFTKNAWSPLETDLNGYVQSYCRDRYGDKYELMHRVYSAFMKFVPLINWQNHQAEFFFKPMNVIRFVDNGDERTFNTDFATPETMRSLSADAVFILNALADINGDEMLMRDVYDIARCVVGRYIHIGLHQVIAQMHDWKHGGQKPTALPLVLEKCIALTKTLSHILGGHRDYSLLHSFEKLSEETRVNINFETTLKENATCYYNRTYVYEHVKYLYIPEMQAVLDWVKTSLENDCIDKADRYYEAAENNLKCYFKLPLEATDRKVKSQNTAFTDAAKQIADFF